MSSIPKQCDAELVRRSIQDVLTEQQEEWLAGHLDDCADCRQMLEGLAASGDDWQRIERVLKDETSALPSSGEGASQTIDLKNLSVVGVQESVVGPLVPHDFAISFLQPCSNEQALGQLNNIEVLSIIGHGGNGIVLKGFQPELNRPVAVKVMVPQLATSAAARKRFAREAQATAAIVHPSVMPILTVHSDGQLPYLVMPYVDCESLQQRLDREGPLPTIDILRISHQVASGLAAAHAQGLVHRDVKPANILLEKGVDRVMLTDFGLARAVDDATLTRTGFIAGTPQYMSPEQARGDSVDTRSDLFSLGSVMYAMSTGRAPFRAETSYGILRRVTDDMPRAIAELNSEIPAWLQGLIGRLMAKSAAERGDDAEHLTRHLEECVAHLQQPSVNPLPKEIAKLVQPVVRWYQPDLWLNEVTRHPIRSVVGVLIPIVLALFVFRYGSTPEEIRDVQKQSQSPRSNSCGCGRCGANRPTGGPWFGNTHTEAHRNDNRVR